MKESFARREFITRTGAVAVLTLLPLAGGCQAVADSATPAGGDDAPRKRPNLVIVFPDQMPGSSLGFLGEEPVITPNLDRFAAQSAVFTQAASNYPVCSPFRAMLMTGQYPLRNGVWGNCQSVTAPFGCELKAGAACWSDVLKGEDYDLGYIGKWHLDAPHKPYVDCSNNKGKVAWNEWCPPERRHGFAYWYAYGTYDNHMRPLYWDAQAPRDGFHYVDQWGPEHEADKAVAFIRNEGGRLRDPQKPFALVVSMNPPHTGYDLVPKRYVKMYDKLDVEALCAKHPQIPPASDPMGRYFRQNIRHKYAQITGVDEQFGRILQALKDAGIEGDTIVVFTSDHGDCVGAHHETAKNNAYEEAFRIPLLVRWPGRVKPRHDTLLISVPDLYPTLLDMMGLKDKVPAAVEGVSLAQAVRDGAGPRPDSQLYFFISDAWEIKGAPPLGFGRRGLRTERHTFVIERREKGAPETVTLFDRQADPNEMKNIAAERPELVREFRTKLEAKLRTLHDPWLKE